MKSLRSFLVLALAFGCADHDIRPVDALYGTYRGIFYRTTTTGAEQQANVEITFSGDNFEGNSDHTKYPAICAGDFKLDGKQVQFSNTCAWTAEFDWTLILDGTFTASRDGRTVTLQKAIGSVTDVYVLDPIR